MQRSLDARRPNKKQKFLWWQRRERENVYKQYPVCLFFVVFLFFTTRRIKKLGIGRGKGETFKRKDGAPFFLLLFPCLSFGPKMAPRKEIFFLFPSVAPAAAAAAAAVGTWLEGGRKSVRGYD